MLQHIAFYNTSCIQLRKKAVQILRHHILWRVLSGQLILFSNLYLHGTSSEKLVLDQVRSIDHTAHNCDLNVQWNICNHLFNLICKSDQINLGSSACRTGYNLNSACAKSQCL